MSIPVITLLDQSEPIWYILNEMVCVPSTGTLERMVMSVMSVDQYVTLTQAADLLGISRTMMWSLVKGGDIPYITSKRDRRVKLIKRRDLEKFAAENPENPQGKSEPPAA